MNMYIFGYKTYFVRPGHNYYYMNWSEMQFLTKTVFAPLLHTTDVS